jgi:hypothetical protein
VGIMALFMKAFSCIKGEVVCGGFNSTSSNITCDPEKMYWNPSQEQLRLSIKNDFTCFKYGSDQYNWILAARSARLIYGFIFIFGSLALIVSLFFFLFQFLLCAFLCFWSERGELLPRAFFI